MRKLIYRASAVEDLRWFFRYYTTVFPEGGSNALGRLDAVELILTEQPMIGRPTQPTPLRVFSISRTPFSLVYRVTGNRIDVLRVKDSRGKLTQSN